MVKWLGLSLLHAEHVLRVGSSDWRKVVPIVSCIGLRLFLSNKGYNNITKFLEQMTDATNICGYEFSYSIKVS